MKKSLAAGLLALGVGVAAATPVSLMIGDNDGFGGSGFTTTGFSVQDHRSAGEAAATNGAQQTDFYSTVFTPLPTSFTMNFAFAGTVNALNLAYRSFGLQASTLGALSATANGIDISSFLNFNDGTNGDATHAGALNSAVIASINTSHLLNLTIGRNGSNDALAFDYFLVSGDQTLASTVPEPTSLVLAATALFGFAAVRRRRHS